MIHGIRNGLGILGRLHLLTDWTAGCIAVTNDEIEEIWGVVPVTTHVHDEGCKIMSRHMEFEAVQIVSIHGCTNSECATLLATAGATAAASKVISDSIVVVGNVVCWFEKQGRCQRFN